MFFYLHAWLVPPSPRKIFESSFGWTQTNCVLKWQWERRKWEAKGAELQDSLESSMRPCLSLLLPPIASTGNRLMHTRAPTVPGHLRSSARWVGERHRPRTSLAARQSALWAPGLPVGMRRTHSHADTQNTPATHREAWSEQRQDGRWGTTHTCPHAVFFLRWTDTAEILNQGILRPQWELLEMPGRMWTKVCWFI